MLAALFGCNTARHAFYDEKENGWQKLALPDSAQLRHTVFLVGGGGGTQADSTTIFPLLAQTLAQASSESTVVFLGDNLPAAHPHNPEKQLAQARASLDRQLAAVRDFPGQTVFLPGDTDWQGGCDAIEWQRQYLQQALGKKKAFLPDNCCGKAKKLKLTDDARLLFADSQWWVQGDAPQETCGSDARFAFLEELREELKKQEDERIVLLMHHPMRSNGPHGGNYSWRHHLFPLTLWKKGAWVPLPVIGSLIVLSRKMGGHAQDLPSYQLVRLKRETDAILRAQPRNESVILVGAHDQSLQLFSEEKKHYIVSGSATGTSFARGGKDARFVQSRLGFAALYFYENKEVWVEFFAKQKTTDELAVVFRKKLFNGVIPPSKIAGGKQAPLPDSVIVSASNAYDAGTLKKLSFGDRYREAWATPVKVPVFNLGGEFKHLSLTGYGGGMSSKSLRLEDKEGHEYVLRSVEKDVSGGLPAEFRQTVVKDLIQDLKSGSHPYGAFAIPTMANAVGIYHTNPRLFYLPKQERLGTYNEAFGDELYLFEERPNNDWGSLPSFGHSHDIISYVDVLDKIHKSGKHRVDEKWALRSRLFDQFVHDYDRHDDQWRWASFPQGDSLTLYRPIPRDRDQVFFDLRGVVPFILSRRWLEMQQRGLNGRIHDVPGEAYPGSRFDRSFLSELDRQEWLEIAQEMKAALTDSVIENAFKAWPPEVYQLNAPHIIEVLKERRDNIPRHAEKLYCFYARYVDVVGTDKRDFFEVERLANGDIEVNVYDQDKEGRKSERFYHRVFKQKETREVRLYGLGGGDIFNFKGEKKRRIRVRIIGGSGSDEVADTASGGLFKKTTVYDVPDGMDIEGQIHDLRSNDLKVNEYDRYEFKYNRYFPLATFGITQDDGLLLGGGVRLTYYRFRKQPYGFRHLIFVRHSANTDAVNLRYNLDIVRAVGKLDFNPDFRFDRPIIFNFFGLGNGTKDDQHPDQFNWVRLEKLAISPLLKRTWYNGRNFTRFGPFFERAEVENRPGRITDTDIFRPDDLDTKNFLGFTVQHTYQLVEGNPVPYGGLKLNLGATYYRNLSGNSGYMQLEGSFTTYISVGSPATLTIASRIGGARLSNDDFLFYHSNNLGGNSYLRGFRNNRFAGRAMFYHNTDLRWKLFYLPNKVMPFDFGVTAGFDYGRVWAEGKDSKKMHTGFSPGIWFTPYKLALVTAFYTLTEAGERDSYTVRLGFFF